MSLVPCKECGVLNSSEADLCLSCEYPIKGRAKTNGFRWVALLLVLVLPAIFISAQVMLPRRHTQPVQPVTPTS